MKKLPIHVKIVIGLVLGIIWAFVSSLMGWNEFTILQSVAIGGITAKNCKPLVKAGVDFLAVISAVWEYPEGPGMGVRALNDAIAEASAS